MAKASRRLAGSAAGDIFVDASRIDCGKLMAGLLDRLGRAR